MKEYRRTSGQKEGLRLLHRLQEAIQHCPPGNEVERTNAINGENCRATVQISQRLDGMSNALTTCFR